MSVERALAFECEGEPLVGIFHAGAAAAKLGVVVIVGGPQYRVGSHRQFVLLARALARDGLPVLRFDYRGMGDCGDGLGHFESTAPDVRAAIDALCAQGIERVVLWGLCDAASAALMYAASDARVAGLVVLNPWVRTDAGMARAYMKHYYLKRVLSPEFWRKVASGQFNLRASAQSLLGFARKLRGVKTDSAPVATAGAELVSGKNAYIERMMRGWEQFSGPVLLVLSGNQDYVADEFRDLTGSARRWRRLVRRATTQRRDFPAANHTFSRADWRDQVAEWTRTWLRQQFKS